MQSDEKDRDKKKVLKLLECYTWQQVREQIKNGDSGGEVFDNSRYPIGAHLHTTDVLLPTAFFLAFSAFALPPMLCYYLTCLKTG